MADLLNLPPPVCDGPFPLVTVAVCTRDRSADLALCLKALCTLEYPNLDLLVIDNAPSDDQTERLVREQYPQVRYICEPRPGLNWARNRAILEAQGEIIAYTDDDVIVDSKWVSALAQTFTENPEVMAVTGLVVPYELETEAQVLFEIHSGFGRGFNRKWYRLIRGKGNNWQRLGTGQFGTGANMAYHRSLFDDIGYFDPALDVGTVTNGGGDLEMFYRVIREGYTLVYEPNAIVRHRHRHDYAKLRTQLANNGVGLVSYWVRTAIAYPDGRKAILRIGLWWLRYWNIRRLWHAFLHKTDFPRDLIMAEFKGFFIGLNRYQKARRIAKGIAESFGPQRPVIAFDTPKLPRTDQPARDTTAVRKVELTELLQPLSDVVSYRNTRIFITWNDNPLGSFNIDNDDQPISVARLRGMLVDRYWLKFLDPNDNSTRAKIWDEALTVITNHYIPVDVLENGKMITTPENLPADVPVSIVVATLDRPDDLRDCLRHLLAQETPRQVEIIVVDNNPDSGLTPPVVAEFPGVVLVNESRRGLAYARNAGFIACKGNIAIATDDDVRMPLDWLEKLVAPFARSDVMIVTGNTLPLELETEAQRLFEKYGGLGRGFERFEVNGEWFTSLRDSAVPTWRLGATANAAFRTSIFSHPHIGLMDEALGPGMPSGVGEDTYLFYKVLKAGHTLVYEPKAYVWHRHRRSLSALQRQLYNYSKGHIAYHLTTLFRDQDFRALKHILLHLPKWRIKQITQYLRQRIRRRKTHYPWSFIWLEIKGNLAGPWGLWQSYRRVKREGQSLPISTSPRNIELGDLNQEERNYLSEMT
jgi:glycosyltransferase involved in cell wall biosynthesis